MINPRAPRFDVECKKVELKQDSGGQYHYFREELDPRFPTPLQDKLDVNILCNADHGHDKVTGRSISGIVVFVGSTPIIWDSTVCKHPYLVLNSLH
jgi:hypothetical protein